MTRLDELTARMIDGLLDEEEARELDTLVRDGRAAESALRLLETEAALRAGRNLPDAAPEVLDRIRRTSTGRTKERVMGAIHASPAPAWKRNRRPWIPFAAAAAVLVIGLAFFLGGDDGLARIESAGSDAVLLREGRETAAVTDVPLRAGDEVRAGTERGLVIRFNGESTQLRLAPETEVTLGGDGRAKRIVLHEGEIEADVAPQEAPLRIESSHAVAEVLGTRLKLSSSPEATRLEVEEGRVRLTRELDGSSVEVPALHYSVAEPDRKLVAQPVVPSRDGVPRVVGFSIVEALSPRAPIPGYEDLRDGAVVDLADLPARLINLEANTDPPVVGSVRFSTAGDDNANTELVKPYTFVPYDRKGRRTWRPEPGTFIVTATPCTGTYGNGVRGESRTITLTILDDRDPAPASGNLPVVTGFSLIAADAPRDPIPGFEDLEDDVEIRLSDLPTRRFNIRANTDPRKVGSVRFSASRDANYNLEMKWPYVVIGGKAWQPGPGTHAVTATPFTDAYGNGLRGVSRTIRITLIDDRRPRD